MPSTRVRGGHCALCSDGPAACTRVWGDVPLTHPPCAPCSGGPAARCPGRERGRGERAGLWAGLCGGAALGHRLLAPPHPERRPGPPQVSLRPGRLGGCLLEPLPRRVVLATDWRGTGREGPRGRPATTARGCQGSPWGQVGDGDLSWTGLGSGEGENQIRRACWGCWRCRVVFLAAPLSS